MPELQNVFPPKIFCALQKPHSGPADVLNKLAGRVDVDFLTYLKMEEVMNCM